MSDTDKTDKEETIDTDKTEAQKSQNKYTHTALDNWIYNEELRKKLASYGAFVPKAFMTDEEKAEKKRQDKALNGWFLSGLGSLAITLVIGIFFLELEVYRIVAPTILFGLWGIYHLTHEIFCKGWRTKKERIFSGILDITIGVGIFVYNFFIKK